MSKTEAANKAKVEGTREKILKKIDILKKLIEDHAELAAFSLELNNTKMRVSKNWFCKWNCEKKGVEAFSKSSQVYKEYSSEVTDLLEFLKVAMEQILKRTKTLKPSVVSKPDLELINTSLATDLIELRKGYIKAKEELNRKNAVITDLKETVSKLQKENQKFKSRDSENVSYITSSKK